MKFTLSWLMDHLDTDADLEQITDKLTAIGLEVEGVDNPAKALAPFIVAEVISAEKHPNADRLKVCRISIGSEEIQVVCGAPNARSGLKGILARPGDMIPSTGAVLKSGEIRGVESRGMMCSAQELKLGDDQDGIIELDTDALAGSSAVDALSLEPVIDVALTPNRVDALGVRGIARDLAAAGLGMLKPIDESSTQGAFESSRTVAMNLNRDNAHLCPHFVGRTIRGVKNQESPGWLKDRLTAIGLRPVSALVDITQYITVDLGRPLHTFDASKLSGDVGPRLAKNKEKIIALDGSTYELKDSMLVIADNDKALAIAGIMGGVLSGCTEETTEVFLESALFDTVNIATTGRSLGIVSDARYCFERGVDINSAVVGAEIATRMIIEICGGEASDVAQGGAEPTAFPKVSFRPAKVSRLGGIDIEREEIKVCLERLGFAVALESAESWQVTVPAWRRDVEGESDLLEEVLRIRGYDDIPPTPLPRPAIAKPAFSAQQRRVRRIRRALAARGLNETTTWSFLSSAQAKVFERASPIVLLDNPISADLNAMRPSLLPNLMLAAGRNADRAIPNIAFFEVGPIFEGGGPGEQTLVACGLRAGEAEVRHWHSAQRSVDVFDAKADALAVLEVAGVPIDRVQTGGKTDSKVPSWFHPGKSGLLRLGPNVLAEFGVLHPLTLKALDVRGPVIGFEVFLDRLPSRKSKGSATRPKFLPSAFQPVERDFAFTMDESVLVENVVRAVRGAEKELISGVQIFDIYTGGKLEDGTKSVALSVRLEPKGSTLTDIEIESISKRIVAAVKKETGGQLRG
ncbi:MAG: phenylalanine--tRNA ligase subunit beta [Rhodospirillaceae bacterium]